MDLNLSIYSFALSTRAYNVTIRENIFTIQDLINRRGYLASLKGVGNNLVDEFDGVLYEFIKDNIDELEGTDIPKLLLRPIDIYNFSTRATNIILKAGFLKCGDLIDNERNIINFEGVGKIVSEEIKNAIRVLRLDIINCFINEYKGDIIDNNISNNITNNDYSDSTYYIPIKRVKSGTKKGILNKREEWKIPINDYLFSIYDSKKEFDLYNFLESYLSTLTDTENAVIEHVIGFIGNSKPRKYSEIAREYGITGERVRQIEKNILDKIKQLFEEFKNTLIGNDYLKNNSLINEGKFRYLNFSEKNNNKINGKFLCYVYVSLYSDKFDYIYISKSREISDSIFFFEKGYLDKKIVYEILDNVDKLYEEKRPEEISYSKDLLLSKIVDNKIIGAIYGNKTYEKILIEYLASIYYVFEFNNSFTFPANKKDLKYIVNKELELLEEPIHFKDMYNIVVEKYPQHDRNFGKVHTALSIVGKNVGDGLYIKKSSKMIEGTITGLTEILLEERGEPVDYKEIEKFILKNRRVKKESLLTMIFMDSKKRFVKFPGHKIGLKKRNLPNSFEDRRSSYTLDIDIYNYMQIDPLKEYTIQELMEGIGDNSYQNVYYAVTNLVKDGKVAFFTRGIINYYYVL